MLENECGKHVRGNTVVYPHGNEYVMLKTGPAAASLGIDFTTEENRVLEFVAEQFKSDGSKTISERSHREDAWTKTPHKDLISFKHATTLSLALPKLAFVKA